MRLRTVDDTRTTSIDSPISSKQRRWCCYSRRHGRSSRRGAGAIGAGAGAGAGVGAAGVGTGAASTGAAAGAGAAVATDAGTGAAAGAGVGAGVGTSTGAGASSGTGAGTGMGAGTGGEGGALPPVLEDAEDPDGGTVLHPPGEERSRSTSMEDEATAEEPPAA
jgi:hypothetical protein